MANVTDPLAAARSETIEWVLRHDKLEAENAAKDVTIAELRRERDAALEDASRYKTLAADHFRNVEANAKRVAAAETERDDLRKEAARWKDEYNAACDAEAVAHAEVEALRAARDYQAQLLADGEGELTELRADRDNWKDIASNQAASVTRARLLAVNHTIALSEVRAFGDKVAIAALITGLAIGLLLGWGL